MKTKTDRIVESIFAVANANPKNRSEINIWLAQDETQTAFEVCSRLCEYSYIDVYLNQIRSTADVRRSFHVTITIHATRPEVTP